MIINYLNHGFLDDEEDDMDVDINDNEGKLVDKSNSTNAR